MDKLAINKINDKYIVRYARKEDCKGLLRLVKELADELNSSDEAIIDVNTFEKYGFDTDTPLYKCLVIENLSVCVNRHNNTSEGTVKENNALVAYALFSFSFSSWYGKGLYLEDIYTSKEHRGKGFGTALFKNIAKIALDSRCNNITLFVFKTNVMKQFFVSKGAENLTDKNGFDYYKINKKSLMNISDD